MKVIESTIRLFKAVPVNKKLDHTIKEVNKTCIKVMKYTASRGFVFSPDVLNDDYSLIDIQEITDIIKKEIILTPEQMNASFHKSWNKVKDAEITKLILEQVIHYFTTYGFEHLGIFDHDSVYIPSEKLEIPEIKNDITLTVIRGYTKEELKDKLLNMLQSGIALSEDTMKDIVNIALYVELNETDIELIKNKEVRAMLYNYLSLFPKDPIEFLRFLVYKATNKTLLIKNRETIDAIKLHDNLDILGLINDYKNKYSLEKLAEIFYRFKPIWLAFKKNVYAQLSHLINKMRKLAKRYHIPMKEDYLNMVTAKIKGGEDINRVKLCKKLYKLNIFRKIRLAYALKYRTNDIDSILYKIRNGKSYATNFSFDHKSKAQEILYIVLNSIKEDIKKNVEGKKIYIPEYIKYALPATEKQFTGHFPNGTCVIIPKDMVMGVHWTNVGHARIDLDLSMIEHKIKLGWDSQYRTSERDILFSGDLTDAPLPNGATESYYVKKLNEHSLIILLNYYNHCEDIEVPFEILIAKQKDIHKTQNYTVDPNSIVCIVKSKIDKKQKMLGLLITTPDECKFYFSETYIGNSITSSTKDYVKNARQYLINFHTNMISFNDILKDSGAILVDNKEDCDIDLSPENIEKDTILSLLT